MSTKNIYRILVMLAGAASLLVTACSKRLDKADPNTVPVSQFFKTAAELQAGTNAIYAALHGNSLVAREWFFVHDLRSDDVATGGGQLEAPRGQILIGATEPTNSVMNAVWNGTYTLIHRANSVIESGSKVTDNTALRDRCIGEAKFLRAWAYNELVTMWGAVPVYTSPVSTADGYKPRVAEDEVYALIIKDLQDAAGILPAKTGTDKGRATNAAANFLLGRVLMQKGDYVGARTALLKIPIAGADGYSLTARYLDNFEEEMEFNNESIFEVVFADKGNNDFNWGGNGVADGAAGTQTTIRNQEYSPVAWRNLIPSDKLLAEFESTVGGSAKNDPRFSYTVYQSGDKINNGSQTLTDAMQSGETSVLQGVTKKISWRKSTLLYKENVSYHPGGNNQRIMRYAEVLLMLAECENEGNNIPAAVGYLNQVRARADVMMPAYPTLQYPVTTKSEVTKALMHEKAVEMACEEVRNIDIMRWRKKGYFTTDPLPYFKVNRDELLPIPQAEIDNNPQLAAGGINKQNKGYF
jgi:tetratricopeptide (TPR) repeat protein